MTAPRNLTKAQVAAVNLLQARLDPKHPGFRGDDFWLSRCGHGAGYWDRDELDVAPVEAIVRATDSDGDLYDIFGRGDTLGDILSALAYGTGAAISRFAYPNLEAWRGWLYFNDGAVHRMAA